MKELCVAGLKSAAGDRCFSPGCVRGSRFGGGNHRPSSARMGEDPQTARSEKEPPMLLKSEF